MSEWVSLSKHTDTDLLRADWLVARFEIIHLVFAVNFLSDALCRLFSVHAFVFIHRVWPGEPDGAAPTKPHIHGLFETQVVFVKKKSLWLNATCQVSSTM